jgi:integrase
MILRDYVSRWRNGSGGRWVSERWAVERVSMLARYLAAYGDLELEEIRAWHVYQIQSQIKGEGFSNALVNRVTAAFTGLLRCAEREELLPDGTHARIVDKIEWLPEPPSGKNQPFTAEERDAILKAAARRSERLGHIHWLLYIATLAYQGFRPSEALGLRWRNVHVADRWFAVCESRSRGQNGKGKNRRAIREVPMAEKLGVIFDLVPPGDPEDRVFVGPGGKPLCERRFLRKVWRPLLEETTIPVRSLPPHCLRHTFSSIAARNGLARDDAAHLTGHSPAMMEKFYARYLGDPMRIDIDKAVRTPKPVSTIGSRKKPAAETPAKRTRLTA